MSSVRGVPHHGVIGLWTTLVGLNAVAWIWALVMFHGRPAALATTLMVYGLGLRHAVDADHIAAIDNVTRKQLQCGRRPIGIGLFFALGHSAVVALIVWLVTGAAGMLTRVQAFQSIGGLIGTSVSTVFLLSVALMNLPIFLALYRSHRALKAGRTIPESELACAQASGLLGRLLRPAYALVNRSWHMLLIGFLFGLGFDTATEVTLFGLSVSQSAHGAGVAVVMVFPALFAAGMCLVDSVNGLFMLGAYEWALMKPRAKLYYNMIITLASVAAAALIGGIQAANLLVAEVGRHGVVARAIEWLKGNVSLLGYALLALFLAAWFVASVRLRSASRA